MEKDKQLEKRVLKSRNMKQKGTGSRWETTRYFDKDTNLE